MRTTILKTGDFIREAEIICIEALEDGYHLEFSSILQTANQAAYEPESTEKLKNSDQ